MVSGSEMASKVSVIICDAERRFPYALPEYPGRSFVRSNDGADGRGIGKKRMIACNKLYMGSKQPFHKRLIKNCLTVFRCMNGGKPTDVSN